MTKRKLFWDIIYVGFLLAAIIVLFWWYTGQNSRRMEERNKVYAADSAQIKAEQINDELNNALSRISAYSYFAGASLSEPVITPRVLKGNGGEITI